MTIEYLKKASKSAATGETETRQIVQNMLSEIEDRGEDAVLKYASKLDGFSGDPVVTKDQIAAAADQVPQRLKDDIQFAYDRVRKFAEAQKASITEFETELSPGLWAGQKLIPIETAGCYVPGGRYAHVASAIMSVGTAKVAGVEHVVACSAPKGNDGVNPAILYTMDLCGADTILALGGVQAIAAMAFGLFTDRPARILAGPRQPVCGRGQAHAGLAGSASTCLPARRKSPSSRMIPPIRTWSPPILPARPSMGLIRRLG